MRPTDPKLRAAKILQRQWVPRQHRSQPVLDHIATTMTCARLGLHIAWRDFKRALKKDLKLKS